MKPDYEHYIGFICGTMSNGVKIHGTCFFISSNKAITAAHNVDKTCEIFQVFLNENVYLISKEDIHVKEKHAVIIFRQSIIIDYDVNVFSYNLNFDITSTKRLDWFTVGFISCDGQMERRYVSGDKCSVCTDEYLCVLSNPSPKASTFRGMSGSPVFINEIIVGILQVEEYLYDIPENLFLSSATEFSNLLSETSINREIYNNISFPRIDYSLIYPCNRRINRWYTNKSNERICGFNELFNNQNDINTYILLGEAGLGKSEELKRIAIECPDNLHPIYCTLGNLTPGQLLTNYIPHIKDYIENGVPFCLILDGYDEIKNYNLREESFPALLSQLIEKINSYNVNQYYIFVGSRTAFYHDGKFIGFTSLVLSRLTKNDIDAELETKNIDKVSFYSEVSKKALDSFIDNPFYLFEIISLFEIGKGILPKRNELMNQIINKLIREQNPGGFSEEDIRESKRILRKISACFMLRGFNTTANENLYDLIEEKIEKSKRDLIRRTGIIDADNVGNLSFKHNNYFEYFAAEFFNKKYSDDLDGLIGLIAYDNKKGIYNNFKNMVTYLLLIRGKNDLFEWILKNCPETINYIEDNNLSEEMSLIRLITLFEEINKKGYYVNFDSEYDFSDIINNRSAIEYLIEKLNKSVDSHELLNSIRVIRELKNLYGMEAKLRETLLYFMVSEKADMHNKRESLFAICELNLSNEETTGYIYKYFFKCKNKEILRGVNYYIIKNDLCDLFSDNLIYQYVDKNLSEYLSFSMYDGLKQFHSYDSMIKLFEAISNIIESGYHIDSSSRIIDVLKVYNSVLCEQFAKKQVPEELFDSIVKMTVLLAKRNYFENNIFNAFLNTTGCDKRAIREYFITLKEDEVTFYYLSKDLQCYVVFLIEKYNEDAFSSNTMQSFFEFCARGLDKGSQDRALCIDAVNKKHSENWQEIIHQITINDNYQEIEEQNKQFVSELIFNYQAFSKIILDLVVKSGIDNPDYQEFNKYIRHSFSYNSKEVRAFGLMSLILSGNDKVIDTLKKYESKYSDWIVLTSSHFIAENNNYSNYLSDEQICIVFEETKKQFDSFESIQNIHLKRSIISLIVKTDITLSKDQLLKMLSIDTYFFNSSKLGFSDYIINKLSHEEIIHQIELMIKQNLSVDSYLACQCIYYCEKKEFVNDRLISFSEKMLYSQNGISVDYAWRYLSKFNRNDIIITALLNDKIPKKYIYSNIPLLVSTPTPELNDYISNLFHELRTLESENVTEENLKEYRKNYDFIDRHHMPDSVERFQSDVLQCIRYIFQYLFKNNINNFIDDYLDEMIERKTFSRYEPDIYNCSIAGLRSVEYLNKLLTLLEISCNHSFYEPTEISVFSNHLYKTISEIGKLHPCETLEIINGLLHHKNKEYRRMVNLLYDNTYRIIYKSSDKEYTISEIDQIVFH